MLQMFKKVTLNRLMQVAIALVLLVGSVFFLKFAIASIISTRPDMAIVDLERHATIKDINTIEQHISRLKIAINLFPVNANLYSLTGRYLSLLSQLNNQTPSESPNYFFATAIKLEPTVYQHRSWHVLYLYKQNGWTLELNESLETALILGKYERLSQKILLPIAFKNWEKLTPRNQQYIHQMLDNMFSTHIHFFRLALKVAQKYCVAELLIEHARDEEQANTIKSKLNTQRGCV